MHWGSFGQPCAWVWSSHCLPGLWQGQAMMISSMGSSPREFRQAPQGGARSPFSAPWARGSLSRAQGAAHIYPRVRKGHSGGESRHKGRMWVQVGR